jgi:hypothetical protein
LTEIINFPKKEDPNKELLKEYLTSLLSLVEEDKINSLLIIGIGPEVENTETIAFVKGEHFITMLGLLQYVSTNFAIDFEN